MYHFEDLFYVICIDPSFVYNDGTKGFYHLRTVHNHHVVATAGGLERILERLKRIVTKYSSGLEYCELLDKCELKYAPSTLEQYKEQYDEGLHEPYSSLVDNIVSIAQRERVDRIFSSCEPIMAKVFQQKEEDVIPKRRIVKKKKVDMEIASSPMSSIWKMFN